MTNKIVIPIDRFNKIGPRTNSRYILVNGARGPLQRGLVSVTTARSKRPHVSVLSKIGTGGFGNYLHYQLNGLSNVEDDTFPTSGRPGKGNLCTSGI